MNFPTRASWLVFFASQAGLVGGVLLAEWDPRPWYACFAIGMPLGVMASIVGNLISTRRRSA